MVQILMSERSPNPSVNGETVTVCPVSSTIVPFWPKQQVSACVSSSARLCVVARSFCFTVLTWRDHTAARSQDRWVAWAPRVLVRERLEVLLELLEGGDVA